MRQYRKIQILRSDDGKRSFTYTKIPVCIARLTISVGIVDTKFRKKGPYEI